MIRWHGTNRKFVKKILGEGLKPLQTKDIYRVYVWLARSFDEAVFWADRKDGVVLKLDIPKELVRQDPEWHEFDVVSGKIPVEYIVGVYVFDEKKTKWIDILK